MFTRRFVTLSLLVLARAPNVSAQTAPEPLQAPNATAAGSSGLTVRPGLEVFAQYALRLTNTATRDTDVAHEFDVPRTHASLTADYEHARARIVLEAVQIGRAHV